MGMSGVGKSSNWRRVWEHVVHSPRLGVEWGALNHKIIDHGYPPFDIDYPRIIIDTRLPIARCCASISIGQDWLLIFLAAAAGTKFRMSLGLPVGAVMNCADNSGAKSGFRQIWRYLPSWGI